MYKPLFFISVIGTQDAQAAVIAAGPAGWSTGFTALVVSHQAADGIAVHLDRCPVERLFYSLSHSFRRDAGITSAGCELSGFLAMNHTLEDRKSTRLNSSHLG